MGGRTPKSAEIIRLEGINHMPKAELEQRREAEKSLLSGVPMKMWPDVKRNKIAREEFERVTELLRDLGKDEALYEGGVNRYCQLYAECIDFENKRETFNRSISELKKEYKNQPVCYEPGTGQRIYELSPSTYYKLVDSMQRNVAALDKQIQSKRNMMLAIEKENLMTIVSALRSIPKKVEKTIKKSRMAEFMEKRVKD